MKTYPTRLLKQNPGTILADAADAPVALTRYGRRVAVVLSPDQYDGLCLLRDAARAEALHRVVDDLEIREGLRSRTQTLLSALRGARRK